MEKKDLHGIKHIAIIMDGNGRWAKMRNKPRSFGHNVGMDRVVDIVEYARKINLEHLSLYAFSTENWKRPQKEIEFLMNLLLKYIKNQLSKLINNGVQVRIIGDISPLPKLVKSELEKTIEQTKNNQDLILNIGINYGGRDEILSSVSKIIKDIKSNPKLDINVEKAFNRNLYTAGQPDPDLLIRPGKEQRISNFMIYQIAYTELYFTDVLWPDFTSKELDKAIEDYGKRFRRFGGL